MYNMVHSFFLIWASWGNVDSCYTNSFHPLQLIVQLKGVENTPLDLQSKWHRYICVRSFKSVSVVDYGRSSTSLARIQLASMPTIQPCGRSLPSSAV